MTIQTISSGPTPLVKIESVGGDLSVRGWDRSEIQADGDELHQRGENGEGVSLSAGGDLSLSVPRGANLTLSYIGGDLGVENLNGTIEISFVGGDAHLKNLTGKVSLAGAIGGEVEMENVGKINMEARRGGLDAGVTARIRSRVEEASRRAQRHAERATHHAEKSMARVMARQAGHRFGRHWNFDFDSPGMGEAKQPVSDEERMVILKMLQDKKITSEEAEKLLSALEGGSV